MSETFATGSFTTRSHTVIRAWAEARGGHPANVRGRMPRRISGPGLVFGPVDENLSDASWNEFFRAFEAEKLAFVCQDRTEDGRTIRFHKFVRV